MALTLDIRDSVLFQEGKKEGKKEGWQEGKQENQRDNILGMLAHGIEHSTIASIAKVNLSYVQQLAQELQQSNK